MRRFFSNPRTATTLTATTAATTMTLVHTRTDGHVAAPARPLAMPSAAPAARPAAHAPVEAYRAAYPGGFTRNPPGTHPVGSSPNCLDEGLAVRTWRLRGFCAAIRGPYQDTSDRVARPAAQWPLSLYAVLCRGTWDPLVACPFCRNLPRLSPQNLYGIFPEKTDPASSAHSAGRKGEAAGSDQPALASSNQQQTEELGAVRHPRLSKSPSVRSSVCVLSWVGHG